MKVLTWNINTAGNTLKDNLVDYFYSVDWDIAALQETKNETTPTGKTLWHSDSSVGNNKVEDNNNNSNYDRIGDNFICGVSLFSKYGNIELITKNMEWENFPFVVLYKVSLLDGKEIFIFNVWLKTYNSLEKKKLTYMEHLKRAMDHYRLKYNYVFEKLPVIMLGDFNIYDSKDNHNEWEKWLTISKELSDEYNIKSAWHRKNNKTFGDDFEKEEFTLVHSGVKYHCDLCLVSLSHFEIKNVIIDNSVNKNNGLKLSDHNPVLVELGWKSV